MDKFGECTFQAIDAIENAKRLSFADDYSDALLELRRAERELKAAIAVTEAQVAKQ